jgi:soluble lytic murein transglycosylase
MKFTRFILGLWLAAALTGCSLGPGLFPPAPPPETATPSITPTLTPSPIPSPTATPLPAVRIEKAEAAFFNGDFDTALLHYATAFKDSSEPMTRAAALWGQGRVFFAEGRYPETIDVLQQLITDYPDSVHLAEAYFLQGQAYYQLNRYTEAAAVWQTYLVLRPNVIDAYVQERRGDALYAAGHYADALAAYTAAIQAPRRDDGIMIDMKVAQTRAELGDYEQAQALYDGIMARTTNDYIKAQAAYLSGAAYQAQGQTEEAFAKFRLAVENYPLSYYAYLSLVELVSAGVQVSDLDRGIVDYFAGQYATAYEVLDRYMAANPVNDGTAAYYRALSLRDLGNYQQAVDAFTYFINNYPSHPKWSEAWDDKAFIQWAYLRQDTVGAQTYLDFVYGVPNSPFAPDYLMYAARAFERANKLDEAAKTWERVANEYPGSGQSPSAVFLAGIVRYRQGKFSDALQNFNRSLALASKSEDRARAYLWIGKAQQKLGDNTATQTAWQQGQITDPGGYYSERCRDLLTGRAPFDTPILMKLSFDANAERADADAWVRLTFNLPADTNLNDLGALASDPRLIRGAELWNLGLYEEARLEFEDLRAALSANAVDSYKLANYLLDLGLYRTAIFAARETLTLAGLDDHTESMMAPAYFSHIRYGLYYSDLVLPAAKEEGLDPLLLFSVIRQESLFEGFIRSTAGARGLMQIVPATGASIAANYGWPLNYTADDLYRPIVSVKLGAHYLANNKRLLGGSDYAALAAYNGGPGNAVAWKEIAGDDPDLFLEVVRFEETRQYIRNIYEIYIIYRRLYSPMQQ